MTMASVQDILESIKEIKSELKVSFKVKQIGIFGSLVRGEQSESSDVDLLVDLDQEADLLDLIGLSQFLEEHLHQRCDVVPRNALRPEIRDQVLHEVKYA